MQIARQQIESTYTDTCTVIEHQKTKVNGVTKFADVPTLEDQPCRLSFKTITQGKQSETVSNIDQVTKLFISPDITIKEGSKIVIERDGNTLEFKSSGIPAIYATHQEIVLDAFKGWS